LKSAPQYSKLLPGAVPPAFAPSVYRTVPVPAAPGGGLGGNGGAPATGEQPVKSATRNVGALIGITAAQAMERGILFAGSPDTVYEQIMSFYRTVGGFDHLIMVGRSGFLTHAEAEKGIQLFAREVLPRLREIAPVAVA
jgi:alkanesulfonate monooxygenase SsuD/methylene tetrahydromethanopterin reductase-like flavin-dependent oxidoreductase (luciferase family)